MIPRPYQARLVEKSTKALHDHGNTLAVAPTGAGKTIMLSMLAGQLQPAKTLILQHRDELVSQNLSKFRKVNPEATVSLYTADTKSWRGQATFAMVQTLCRDKNLATLPKLDLLVIDEAHHVAAKSYMDIVGAIRAKNPACMIAGFTATPSRGDKKGLRSVFSNVADQITLKELINGGFLVHPRTFVIDVGTREELSKVKKLASDFDMEAVEGIMNRKVINDEVVTQWKNHAGDRKTIVFCSTIQHAVDVTESFRDAGVSAELVSGETPSGERAAILRRLKTGQTQMVVNVAVLTEGFDEPSISCVILLRPCSYKSTMIQMIGRGLRTINPEEYPGIIKRDCVILDFGTSVLTHGNIEADAVLDDRRGTGDEEGEAPEKVCPEEEGGCGAIIPTGCKSCPMCGYVFPSKEQEEGDVLENVQLTELDIMAMSPFAWVDLFGSGKVLMASGFNTWAGIFSPDSNNWWALGKSPDSKLVRKLLIGDRQQAMSAADDFLRENETSGAATKSRRWLKDMASEKQRDHLRKVGYEMGDLDFGWTKYTAACHLNFQWNRRMIEVALGVRR